VAEVHTSYLQTSGAGNNSMTDFKVSQLSRLTCICTHIHREGNQVANALALHGQSLTPFASQWCDSPPRFIFPLLARDMSEQPFQRLVFE